MRLGPVVEKDNHVITYRVIFVWYPHPLNAIEPCADPHQR